eukprot:CAMPEP_0197034094 /NCGR_PEP_ID=MMETSP1384-20130603/12302_1 /TAXON_ID=29189 /ORGANISM="Ammonia sp." /LENGTH=540 /DNA_ID=CAMNT_0042463977 /DNA_START=23 /DNA_END=1645 /DNA_ORIENTATION=+
MEPIKETVQQQQPTVTKLATSSAPKQTKTPSPRKKPTSSSSSSSGTPSSANTNSAKQHKRRSRRRARIRQRSVTDAVKQQFDELLSTFESFIDGHIPLTSQASKLKQKVDEERKKLIDLLKTRQQNVTHKFQQKTLKFRVDVQKSLRRRITGNPNRSIRRYIKEPPQIKFIDKMSFTLSMLTLLLSELFLLSYPFAFKYFYAVMLVPLMIGRYIDYKDKKYHFFMFDFCYFINFLSMAHICFFPNSTWLFETLFVLANGPVLFAIMVWRNSMVLHSLDKMTSLFIHAFPPFYTYCYRWLDTSRVRVQSTELSIAGWLYYPTIMYLIWQFSYLFKTEVVSKSYLDENEDVETSLRWLARDSKNFTNKLGRKLCISLKVMRKDEQFDSTKWKTKLIFVLLNFMYYMITVLPAFWIFRYKYVHLGVMLFAIFSSVWQGANYYIEVFSERYSNSLEKKAKQLEEKYLFIDENLDSLLRDKWNELHSDVSDTETQDDDAENEYDTSDTSTSDNYTDGYSGYSADQSKSVIDNGQDTQQTDDNENS